METKTITLHSLLCEELMYPIIIQVPSLELGPFVDIAGMRLTNSYNVAWDMHAVSSEASKRFNLTLTVFRV